MTSTATSDARHLVAAGKAAVDAGNTVMARTHFRNAIDHAPDCVAGWFGLSQVTLVLSERRAYLEQVLTLDPAHTAAQADLAIVKNLIAQGQQLMPKPRPAVPGLDATPVPPAPVPAAAEPALSTYCYNHPDRATALRCVSCDQPICTRCAHVAPVGQLCPACRRKRRPVNYQVTPRHLVIGGAVTLALSLAGSSLLSLLLAGVGFYSFCIAGFIGTMMGGLLVRVLDRVTRAKRGRAIQITVGVALVLGMLPALLFGSLLPLLLSAGLPATVSMFQMGAEPLWFYLMAGANPVIALYMIVTVVAAMYRLR